MFVSIQDRNKKTLWTHSSLLAIDRANSILKLDGGKSGFQNKVTLFSTYASLEAVNRIGSLKKLNLYYRAGSVAGVFLLSRLVSSFLYDYSIETEKRRLLDGAPVWQTKLEVPEIDKKFFFIDDDNNFEPSLWHHGINSIEKPKQYYKYE